ncbi:MAG: UDP-3-O-[3-hydroxymyristoyl] glucosamine N-acyltransferase [Myxococcota bacterium]
MWYCRTIHHHEIGVAVHEVDIGSRGRLAMRYVWILSVIIVGTPRAWAEDLNGDGCEDIQYAANTACISDSASLDPTVTTVAGTFVGAEASVGPFVALDDVHISPRATLDGWVAHVTKPLPVGLGTVVGRNATLGVDHILGTDTTISRAVTAGARLTTGTGATVGYAAVLGTDVTVDANGTVGNLVELGNFTHVGTTAVIARSSTVADSASSGAATTILGIVGPNVTVGADVLVEGTARVRKHATLLDGAQVLDGARVGRGAIVKAGATVSGVVRANATVCEGATLGATDLVSSGGTWPPIGCALQIVDNAGVREWSNGTYAASCNDYINPATGHSYTGATGDGLYRIDPTGNSPFKAHCDMTTESGGWVDVVESYHARSPDTAALSAQLFSGSPGTTMTVSAMTGGTGDGVFLYSSQSRSHNEALFLTPTVDHTSIRLSYQMQGDEGGSRCSTSNWIPLSGPGYNGGHSGYLVSCLSGFSCIQGTPQNGRDAPISVSNYTLNGMDPTTTLLAWSGSNQDQTTATGCARDPNIPTNHEGLFITKLLIR